MSGKAEPLKELESFSKLALIEHFTRIYRQVSPSTCARRCFRAVVHRHQEVANGGPDLKLQRRLEKLAEELKRTGKIDAAPRPVAKPGTRLLRDWQGETHTVTVLEKGFLYRGGHYQSLSVIARQITGSQWSGPAFFGLRQKGARP